MAKAPAKKPAAKKKAVKKVEVVDPRPAIRHVQPANPAPVSASN